MLCNRNSHSFTANWLAPAKQINSDCDWVDKNVYIVKTKVSFLLFKLDNSNQTWALTLAKAWVTLLQPAAAANFNHLKLTEFYAT